VRKRNYQEELERELEKLREENLRLKTINDQIKEVLNPEQTAKLRDIEAHVSPVNNLISLVQAEG
jgi:Spy/CpxP family protein refolding chaperone